MFLAASTALIVVDIVCIVIIIAWAGTWVLNRWRRSHYATVLDQDEFQKGMHKAQVLDLRNKDDFNRGHILGARSLPLAYLQQTYADLRPDLPVYLYDAGEALSIQGARVLSKHGFQHVYILKGGYAKWNGKTKKAKYND